MSLLHDMPRAHWGLAGFCFGVFALIAAGLLTSGMLAPAQEAAPSIGTVIGEIARDIRLAAKGGAPAAPPRFCS